MSTKPTTGQSSNVRIAVDIGGTFTDLQILNEATGNNHAHKTPTTPGDPSEGLLTGLQEAAELFGFSFDQISILIHGTTIATNAVLERKLPTGALITTAGFEDVLEIGRHLRTHVYTNKAEERTLLIPRSRRFGLKERTKADGSIECALNDEDIKALAQKLTDCGAETVAVSLLHSYANPGHERRVAQILEKCLPQMRISISSDISPEFREFERTSTTVLNALLMPVVGDYLKRLGARLTDHGLTAPVYLVQSNGGVATPQMAARHPARLLLSGPSGGAKAAETIAHRLGRLNLVAVDMGGTSYDVSLVEDGRVHQVNQGEVDGCPVRLPMVEMRTIGAGGGSIARTDTAGGLYVGPESAGAVPGPACYDRGGKHPTVTDANVTLGRIDPLHFLGGAMRLNTTAAQQAVTADVAVPLKLDLEETAEGITQIAVAHMASAIRLSLFEKGLDPEDFALVSFGGAGGLHACDTAAELDIKQVIFPSDPGTLSAWGMLYADIAHDLTSAQLMNADAGAKEELAKTVAILSAEGLKRLSADGIAEKDQRLTYTLDLRYSGQAYEIATPFTNTDDLESAVATFHELHQAKFAHSDASATPEIINLRMSAIGTLAKPKTNDIASGDGKPRGHRRIYSQSRWHDVPIIERASLETGTLLYGPLIIEEAHSTILVPHDWSLTPESTGELIANVCIGDDT
ncbi:MAG: hydantoinase/oxoprolinase family protein [Rhodospirillales bacterium]|jgi:N-methylhydantoinase A